MVYNNPRFTNLVTKLVKFQMSPEESWKFLQEYIDRSKTILGDKSQVEQDVRRALPGMFYASDLQLYQRRTRIPKDIALKELPNIGIYWACNTQAIAVCEIQINGTEEGAKIDYFEKRDPPGTRITSHLGEQAQELISMLPWKIALEDLVKIQTMLQPR